MKLIYLNVLFTLICSSVFSQDTITSADMPVAGQTYIVSTGQAFTGMDVVTSGANMNWDFSQLTFSDQNADTIYNPATTNPLLGLFFIDNSINPNRSNQAIRDNNSILALAGASDIFNYNFNSAASFSQSGFGAVLNGAPLPVAFAPHDVIYRFPLKYGDADSASYHYEIDLTSVVGIFYGVEKSRSTVVDGWGSLTTPFGTFDVLRVKSTIVEQDSIFVDSLGFGFQTPSITTKEYKWLSRSHGIPILQINTTGNDFVSQIRYQDSSRAIGIDEILLDNLSFNLFPNPSNGIFSLSYSLNKKCEVSFSITSMDGKIISEKEGQMQSAGDQLLNFDLTSYNLPQGIYCMNVSAGNSKQSRFFTIRK